MQDDQSTVFIVDDDPSIRKSLTRLFLAVGFKVVAHDSADAFLDAFLYDRPGCIVVDLQMPEVDGLELQRRLKEVGCHLPTVFISGHGDIPSTVKAMREGAVDFLPKPFDTGDLVDAVRRALARDQTLRAERNEIEDVNRLYAELSPREREVFSHVVMGAPNKEIGERMGISEKTVKVHRARVMEKMLADSLAELVRLAEKIGM